MACYVVALAVTDWASTAAIAPLIKAVLGLAPLLPGLLLIWLTVNAYRRSDEFIQCRILEAAALTAVSVATFVLIYSFFESLGWPRLSMAWISDMMWAVFAVLMIKLLATGA